MTIYWDNAHLGAVKLQFDIDNNDGKNDRVHTTSYVPDETSRVTVRMEYGNHAFLFQNKVLIGIRNGTPEYRDPVDYRDSIRYVTDLVDALVASCNDSELFRRGQLPEGIIEVLRQGADIEPYVRMDDEAA
jgi:hypothetical protein